MAKSKQTKSERSPSVQNEHLAASEEFAQKLEYWHKRLAPEMPNIDPHNLNLIIASMLKTPEQRMEIMLLHRREDGVYLLDEKFLAELIEAVEQAEMEVILINNAVSIAHEAPVVFKEVDFMVRDHPQLQEKLNKFAEIFGVTLTRYSPLSKVIRAVGRAIEIDFVSSLPSGQSFEAVRSRATKVPIGQRMIWVAVQADIVAAKETNDLQKRTRRK
ncbi:MAG: hypothetical protein ONB46_23625 [candidate division KSB1 bacterium]|nr:hypothetical protein [candidate division KSB1 bacterium]MDZ7368857.1 hypothetical protein [candidate division KSB1 bacterium]MDZ7407164.1 hypothetical protein [candidate division KSB1 bacterium]